MVKEELSVKGELKVEIESSVKVVDIHPDIKVEESNLHVKFKQHRP